MWCRSSPSFSPACSQPSKHNRRAGVSNVSRACQPELEVPPPLFICLQNSIECRRPLPFVRPSCNLPSSISHPSPPSPAAQGFMASAASPAQQCRGSHARAMRLAIAGPNCNSPPRPNDAAAFHTILRMMQECQFSAYGVQTKNLASSKTATLRDKWRLRRYLTPDGKVCAAVAVHACSQPCAVTSACFIL